jgi:hypothetical protein
MGMLPCNYDMLVVMWIVFRLFYHTPQGIEVICVLVMALNCRWGEICSKSPIYILKKPGCYVMHLSKVLCELLRIVRYFDLAFAVNTQPSSIARVKKYDWHHPDYWRNRKCDR